MEEREEKLIKAREKLEKFRKKKQKMLDPSKRTEEVQSNASSACSPVMFQATQCVSSTSATNAASTEFRQSEMTTTGSNASLASYFGASDSSSGITGFEELSSTHQTEFCPLPTQTAEAQPQNSTFTTNIEDKTGKISSYSS